MIIKETFHFRFMFITVILITTIILIDKEKAIDLEHNNLCYYTSFLDESCV